MCRLCKNIVNVSERGASHDFMEQIREYYGIEPKNIKSKKSKNFKKSVLDKIEDRIKKIQNLLDKNNVNKYQDVLNKLINLKIEPYDENFTPSIFQNIMDEYETICKDEVLNYLRQI